MNGERCSVRSQGSLVKETAALKNIPIEFASEGFSKAAREVRWISWRGRDLAAAERARGHLCRAVPGSALHIGLNTGALKASRRRGSRRCCWQQRFLPPHDPEMLGTRAGECWLSHELLLRCCGSHLPAPQINMLPACHPWHRAQRDQC